MVASLSMIGIVGAIVLAGALFLPATRGALLQFLVALGMGFRLALQFIVAAPFRFTILLLWFVLLLGLLFGAASGQIYGSDSAREEMVLLIYMTSVAFVFSQSHEPQPFLGVSAGEFVIVFALTVAIAAGIFAYIQPFNPDRAVLTTASTLVLVTHIFVVAFSEELLFRYALPGLIPGPRLGAQWVSGALFGLMHYWAYGANWHSILFAGAIGIVFGTIVALYPRHGLIVTIALHATWNAAALGFVIGGAPQQATLGPAAIVLLALVVGALAFFKNKGVPMRLLGSKPSLRANDSAAVVGWALVVLVAIVLGVLLFGGLILATSLTVALAVGAGIIGAVVLLRGNPVVGAWIFGVAAVVYFAGRAFPDLEAVKVASLLGMGGP